MRARNIRGAFVQRRERNHRPISARAGVLAVSLAAVTLLGACGSGATSNGSSASDRIVIGTLGPRTSSVTSLPDIATGIRAAIASVNAAGGVKGHRIQLVDCDTRLEANQELACTRKMISEKVTAVVAGTIAVDQSGVEIKQLDKAGIPYFGSSGVSVAELTGNGVYLLASGSPGWFYGAAKVLRDNGVRKIGIYGGNNTASVNFGVKQVKKAVADLGFPEPAVVLADPASDPTLAASASKIAASGVDGIIMLPENPALMMKAVKASGFTGKVSSFSSQVDAGLASVGAIADGIYVSSQTAFVTDSGNPEVAKFLADMRRFEPDGKVSLNSLSGYAAVRLFAKIAATVPGGIDAASFRSTLDNLAAPVDTGLVGPWAIKGRPAVLPAAPRVLNPNIAYGIVRGGKIVAAAPGFSNPFPG
ncbi:ABC transporter substrate-binding protein [Cryptosporangium sp. NPDC051539]|uniref:ABC transporter substrate-binding protein n=1 Tax=Cryptosporangium sp. NPDC051539 TaxID=3363962 RepID=UPI0037BB2D5C